MSPTSRAKRKPGRLKRQVIKEGHFDKILNTHYSEGIRVGNLVFVAGQIAVDDQFNFTGKDDPDQQARKIFENMRGILKEAGATMQDVVMVNLYVTDIKLLSKIAQARRDFFSPNRPVATLVEVSKLAHPDAVLEVNAIAVISR